MPEFRMPSLGADMQSGILSRWLVKPGDPVKRGQIVAVVETDKAEIEVECFDTGVVEELLVEEGVKVPVGTPLARLGAAAAVAGVPAAVAPAPVAVPAAAPVAVATPAPPAPSPVPVAPPPAPVAPPVEVILPPPSMVLPPPERPPARRLPPSSPLARRMAALAGVDLAAVTGSGPGGVIVRRDVLAAQRAAPAPPPPPQPPAPTEPASAVESRLRSMREATGALMARSKREIPHYYLQAQVDMSRALQWLADANAQRPVAQRLLPAVLLLKAAALACHDVPDMNGHYAEGAFIPSPQVHLGVAISLRQGGLIAPALHDADTRSLDDLMAGLLDLVKRARVAVLRSSEMTDGTITVTNLGDQGAGAVFGVIHPPQVALVGFGRVTEKVVAQDGMIAVRPMVTVTLSADHRVSDGHRGSLYLAAIARLLQEPEKL